MEKDIEIVMLYDIYGKLLTVKQQKIFEEYYLYNLSLREIAENKNISYQAVRDSIKSSESMLVEFENTVHMNALLKRVEKASSLCDNFNDNKDEIIKLLKIDKKYYWKRR